MVTQMRNAKAGVTSAGFTSPFFSFSTLCCIDFNVENTKKKIVIIIIKFNLIA